jgi:hypothetical protein
MHIHSTSEACCFAPLSVTIVYCNRSELWRVHADGFHGMRLWEDDSGYHDEAVYETLAEAIIGAARAFDVAMVWLARSRSAS